MQMVAADWLRSDKREDDLAGRPESIVQAGFFFPFLAPFFYYSLCLYVPLYNCMFKLYKMHLLEYFYQSLEVFFCRNMRHKGGQNSSLL